MNIKDAAAQAAQGFNEPLFDACWKLSVEHGYWCGPGKHIFEYEEVCEQAISEMTPEQRAQFGVS